MQHNQKRFSIKGHEVIEKDNPGEGLQFTFDGIVTEDVTRALTSRFPDFPTQVTNNGDKTIVYIKPQRQQGRVVKDACHDETAIQSFIDEVKLFGQYYQR